MWSDSDKIPFLVSRQLTSQDREKASHLSDLFLEGP